MAEDLMVSPFCFGSGRSRPSKLDKPLMECEVALFITIYLSPILPSLARGAGSISEERHLKSFPNVVENSGNVPPQLEMENSVPPLS